MRKKAVDITSGMCILALASGRAKVKHMKILAHHQTRKRVPVMPILPASSLFEGGRFFGERYEN